MNLNLHSAGFGFFAFLAVVWGLLVTVFWLVVAWRAMRAHERLASAAEELARKNRPNPLQRSEPQGPVGAP
jgi:uncharacterized membrane protein